MDYEIFLAVLDELINLKWNKRITQFRPYLNGDPLLEPRLGDFLRDGKKYLPNSKTIVLSNGAIYPLSKKLLDPLIDVISLTISASSKETYKAVHGSDGFNDVLKTYDYIIKNKNKNQEFRISYILCNKNYKELEDFKKLFNEADYLDISAIHVSETQKSSYEALKDYAFQKHLEKTNICNSTKLYWGLPCNCWNNLSISHAGYILHCCDLPYAFNHGKIGTTSIKKGWKRRLNFGTKTNYCYKCNLKNLKNTYIEPITKNLVNILM